MTNSQPVVYCSQCGAQNLAVSRFCFRCGAKLAAKPESNNQPEETPVPLPTPPAAPAPQMPVPQASTQKPPAPVKSKKKLGTGGIIAIIIGSIFLIVLCVLAIISIGKIGKQLGSLVLGPSQATAQAESEAADQVVQAAASLEPEWFSYTQTGPNQSIDAISFIGPVHDVADYDYEFEDYFRMFTDNYSTEECSDVFAQCGDGQWIPVNDGDSIESGCKIKISKGRYCHFLLPDGSLLSAFNAGAYDETIAATDNLDLIFQVNLGTNETRILQNVTLGKSGIWHFLPEQHAPYIVEIGDYEIEFLGTRAITGSPERITTDMSRALIEARVLKGKIVVKKNPVYYQNSTDSVIIEANDDATYAIQTPAYLGEECPYPYVKCGNGCIPRTNQCCPNTEVEGSWCRSRFSRCVENTGAKDCSVAGAGPMTDDLQHSSGTSQFCCEPAIGLDTGSKDVLPGYKFCGMDKLIPASEPCCYNGQCGGQTKANFEIVSWASDSLNFGTFVDGNLEMFMWMNNAYKMMSVHTKEEILRSFRDKLKSATEEGMAAIKQHHIEFCKIMDCDEDTSGSDVDVPVPSMSGSSGSSGTFPTFYQSDCWTTGGHYHCNTETPGLEGEWDLTEICRSYPNESFCSWSGVQATLP